MFDTLIKPILLYNHEIWGAEVPTILQRRIVNDPQSITYNKILKQIDMSPAEQLHLKIL